MTEKRVRIPLSKVRIPSFERDYPPAKPARGRTRFKTVDDVVFEVVDASVIPSTYMKRLIHNPRAQRSTATETPHPLPNVAADVFETVLKYCYFHTSKFCDGLLPAQVKDWDDEFMNLDPRQLCELASAAYYLDVKDLIDLTCRAIAAIISGKTAEQIRKTFHIENDLAGTIDRMLPKATRRRGPEGSPRKGRRDVDENDSFADSEDPENAPGPQKSVEELTEWINSTSSKKKKKKKRHKDKSLPKRNDEDNESDSRLAALSPTAPPDPRMSDSRVPNGASNAGSTQSLDENADDVPENDQTGASSSGENETSYVGDHKLLGADKEQDKEAPALSDSDVIFVSDTRCKEEERHVGNGQPPNGTNGSHVGSIAGKVLPLQPHLKERQPPLQSVVHSDTESVQWVPNPERSSNVKGEETSASPHDNHVTELSDDSKPLPALPNGGSHSHACETKPQLIDSREDLEIQFHAMSDTDAPGEAFIDCPENMDREVEAFQKRLTITESPPVNHSAAHVFTTLSHAIERERDHIEAARANGQASSSRVLQDSHQRNIARQSVGQTMHEEEDRVMTNDAPPKPSGDPPVASSVRSDISSLEQRKKDIEKRAAQIDELVAKLSSEREKVRDSLASINMELMQLRREYNISNPDA